jgi:Regulator of chromosome condensation (RCC1) repeat
MRHAKFILLAFLTAVAACADTPAGPQVMPTGVQIVAGDGQLQGAGVAVHTAPTVRVSDADGRPMRGIAVTFASRLNAGVDPVVAFTDQDGVASTSWSLRSDGGEDTLLAKVDSLAPAVFHATSLVFSDISADYGGTCGVATSGRAFCWGANPHGELGTGDSVDAALATPVAGGRRYTQYLFSGIVGASCGLDATGQLFCAGLSAPVAPYGPIPRAEGGSLRFNRIVSASVDRYCGLEVSGMVYCWGWGWQSAFSPPADTVPGALAPFYSLPGGPAQDLSLVTLLHTGFGTSFDKVCASRAPGVVDCYAGWLSGPPAFTPIFSGAVKKLVAIVSAVCWIDAADVGTCEDQTTGSTASRMTLPGITWDMSSLDENTCAATDAGVFCWDTPRGSTPPTLEPSTVGMDFRRIAVGGDHKCAIDAHSRAWCWGANDNGQLGDGTTDSSAVPRQVKFAL